MQFFFIRECRLSGFGMTAARYVFARFFVLNYELTSAPFRKFTLEDICFVQRAVKTIQWN